MKFLSERIGKAGAIGIGIALAVALVVGGREAGFSFVQLAPFAIIMVFAVVTYLLYSVFAQFGSNKLAAFAVAYCLAWIFSKQFLSAAFQVKYDSIFTWMNLLFVVLLIISIWSLVRMVMSLGSGNGFGGGNSFGRNFGGDGSIFGSGTGGGGLVSRMLDGAGNSVSRWQDKRIENAGLLASQVQQAMTGTISEIEALKEKERNLQTLAESVKLVDNYIEQAELAVKEFRVMDGPLKNRADLSLKAYRDAMREQAPELQKHFDTQNAILAAVTTVETTNLLDNTERGIEAMTREFSKLEIAKTAEAEKDIEVIRTAAQVLQAKLLPELNAALGRAKASQVQASTLATAWRLTFTLKTVQAERLLQEFEGNEDFKPATILAKIDMEKQAMGQELSEANAAYGNVQQLIIERRQLATAYLSIFSRVIPDATTSLQKSVRAYTLELSVGAYSNSRGAAQTVLTQIAEVPKVVAQSEALVLREAEALQKLKEFETRASQLAPSQMGPAQNHAQRMQQYVQLIEKERIAVVEACMLVQTAIEAYASIDLLCQAIPYNLPKDWEPNGWSGADQAKRTKLAVDKISSIKKQSVDRIAAESIKQLIRVQQIAKVDGVSSDRLTREIAAAQKEIEDNFEMTIKLWNEVHQPAPQLGPAPTP